MDYVSELELKSLIIRIKNSRVANGSVKNIKTVFDNSPKNVNANRCINQKIDLFVKLSNATTGNPKIRKLRKKLSERIIKRSEEIMIDSKSYNKFGCIILLIIDRIMKKSQFRGYSYKDDFKSDASYKILKYLDNFNYLKVSSTTGQPVSAFSYITTIIHHSFIHIINKEKEFNDFINDQLQIQKAKIGFLEDFSNDRPLDIKDKYIKHIVYIDDGCNVINECDRLIDKYEENLKDPSYSIEIVCNKKLDISDYAYLGSIKKSHMNIKIVAGN